MKRRIRVKNKLFHNTNIVCVASIVTVRCNGRHKAYRSTNIALCAKGSAGMEENYECNTKCICDCERFGIRSAA